jgi:hypothetical protein
MFSSFSHPPADQRDCQMQQALEIGRLFFITHSELAVVVHPRVGSFHDPATCLALGAKALPGSSLLGHMRDVTSVPHHLLRRLPRVALIDAKVLRFPGCRSGPLHYDRVQRWSQQFHVVSIGSGDDKRERGATAVYQQTALGPFFSPGLSGYFRPPPEPVGPCPASRPDSAIPRQSLPFRHTPPTPLATTAQKTLRVATSGSACGSRWHCQRLWATPSTDIPCAARRRWQQKCRVGKCVCGHHQAADGTSDVCSNAGSMQARAVRLSTRVHRTLPKIGSLPFHKDMRMPNVGSNIIYG